LKFFSFYNCGNFNSSYKEELSLLKGHGGRVLAMTGLILALSILPLLCGPYLLKMIGIIGIYSIAAMGLNMLTGYTGMVSLGHGAIFGIGALSTAALTAIAGVPVWIAIPVGGTIAVLAGLGFSLPALRLPGYYLCFATLAGQKIFEYLFACGTGLSKGMGGASLTGITLKGQGVKNDVIYYYVVLILLAVMSWISVNLMRSKYGRAFAAIRDNEATAEAIGIPVLKYKALSFAVSSFYAGIAGALLVNYNSSVNPGVFNLSFSIILIAMIVIGGMGTLYGPVLGAIALVSIREALVFGDGAAAGPIKLFGQPFSLSASYELFAGFLLVMFIVFKWKGIAGILRSIAGRFRSWPFLKHGHYESERLCTPDK
jgi:branched-chain amino acid transport system permease protein